MLVPSGKSAPRCWKRFMRNKLDRKYWARSQKLFQNFFSDFTHLRNWGYFYRFCRIGLEIALLPTRSSECFILRCLILYIKNKCDEKKIVFSSLSIKYSILRSTLYIYKKIWQTNEFYVENYGYANQRSPNTPTNSFWQGVPGNDNGFNIGDKRCL